MSNERFMCCSLQCDQLFQAVVPVKTRYHRAVYLAVQNCEERGEGCTAATLSFGAELWRGVAQVQLYRTLQKCEDRVA